MPRPRPALAALGRVLARPARALWRWRQLLPLTPLGALVVATALVVRYVWAASTIDFVLHAAGLVALGLVGFSVLLVLLVGALLWLRLRAMPAEAAAEIELQSGVRSATGFTFPHFGAWPLVQLRLRWTDPPRVAVRGERRGGRLEEVVEPEHRGHTPVLWRRFVVSDIFGLARVGLPRRSPRSVRVLPARARLSGHVITHFVGGDALSYPTGPADGELLDMRRYVHGDPLRRVLWKAYARTRQLMVRTPERAIAPSPSGVAYFVAGPDDEPCASAARFFVEEGLLGRDFLFSADGSGELTDRPDEALDQIVRSVAFRRRGGEGLSRFVDQLDPRRRQSCVLFLPPRPGPWLERVERTVSRLPGATALLAVDRQLTPEHRRWLARLLFAPGAEQRRAQRALPEVVRRLGRCGLSVRVLHRPSGQLIPAAQLEALAR